MARANRNRRIPLISSSESFDEPCADRVEALGNVGPFSVVVVACLPTKPAARTKGGE